MSPSSNHPNYAASERSSTSVPTVVLTLAGSVIVLAALKGGTAKTTSAVYLAVAAHRDGADVCLLDAAPQGIAAQIREIGASM